MKKLLVLLLTLLLVVGCGGPKTDEPSETPTEETTEEVTESTSGKIAPAETGSKEIAKLVLEFVPSKDADVIITGTANLNELLIEALADEGYTIDEVDITVGTSYDATVNTSMQVLLI